MWVCLLCKFADIVAGVFACHEALHTLPIPGGVYLARVYR
jgi:hypothetical protein